MFIRYGPYAYCVAVLVATVGGCFVYEELGGLALLVWLAGWQAVAMVAALTIGLAESLSQAERR